MFDALNHCATATITGLKASEIQEVYNNDKIKVWWDVKVTTKPPVEHNKPDLIVWKKVEKVAYIVDVG